MKEKDFGFPCRPGLEDLCVWNLKKPIIEAQFVSQTEPLYPEGVVRTVVKLLILRCIYKGCLHAFSATPIGRIGCDPLFLSEDRFAPGRMGRTCSEKRCWVLDP
jgi:hypothetical protein